MSENAGTPSQDPADAVHAQLVAVGEDWSAAIVSNDFIDMAHRIGRRRFTRCVPNWTLVGILTRGRPSHTGTVRMINNAAPRDHHAPDLAAPRRPTAAGG